MERTLSWLNHSRRLSKDYEISISSVEAMVKIGVSVEYLAGVIDNPEQPIRLSKTEQQLVEAFRTLTQPQKELILQNVQFMQKQNRRE